MSFTLAIIGRPNVGKSTLFNRLTKTRLAIVHDIAGVTRDRKESFLNLGDTEIKVIDTAGLEEAENATLEGKMMEQTEIAIEEADIILMVIDGIDGVTPVDRYFAKMLRKSGKSIILAVNKCDTKKGKAGVSEGFDLGFGKPLEISAAHSMGIADLQKRVANELKIKEIKGSNVVPQFIEESIKIAIVGRPNAGKSTFINKLLGHNRLITGEMAGITRDAIEIEWNYKGNDITLVDTAGMRKKSRVSQNMEKMSVSDAIKALNYAHVAVLMIDGTCPLEKQDLTIMAKVESEGRVPIIAVNKWDLVKEKDEVLEEIRYMVEKSLPQIKGVEIVTMCAEKGKGVEKVIDAALEGYELWNKRISTSKLNNWLQFIIDKHPPPLVSGRRIKIRYMTQVKTRPATFMLSVSSPDELPKSYLRYLINCMRKDFDIWGVPIRVNSRKKKNPYV